MPVNEMPVYKGGFSLTSSASECFLPLESTRAAWQAVHRLPFGMQLLLKNWKLFIIIGKKGGKDSGI